MLTDAQLEEKIKALELTLDPHKKNNEGRCPIRLKINTLRWRLKTRTFRPAAETRANCQRAAVRRWETCPTLRAKKQLAEDKRLLAEVIGDIRKELVEKRKVVTKEKEAQRNRKASLAAYHKNRDAINVKRQEEYHNHHQGKPLDQIFRTAIKKRELWKTQNRADFFHAIQRLETKLINRTHTALLRALRRRLNVAFKAGRQYSKTARELLGCEIPHLRSYLESLWKPGMSWANYGYDGWHLDHIKPCAKFDLSNPEQRQQCFHWTNLQPLWAKENLSKGAK